MTREDAVELLGRGPDGVRQWNERAKERQKNASREAPPEMLELDGLNLAEHSLRGVRLNHSRLLGALFYRARMLAANLEQATLRGANFKEADLRGARDLGSVKEPQTLASVKHLAPSSLGLDTLARSAGKIPREFLRGCGLSDWEVEMARLFDPALTPADISELQYRVFELRARGPIQLRPLFISYCHGDEPFVARLCQELDARSIRYWRDVKDATAGRIDKVLERGITMNPTFLLVLSEESLRSEWVEFEIDSAVQLAKTLRRDVLCPVSLDSAWKRTSQLSGSLLTQLKKYVILDFADWREPSLFNQRFNKLVEGLTTHYGAKAMP